MNNVKAAIDLLTKAGYKAFGFGEFSVVVIDPVSCQSGSKAWTEEKEVRLNVSVSLNGVHRFINERE